MTAPEVTAIHVPDGPQLRLLDARNAGLDEQGLRTFVREHEEAAAAPFSSRSYRAPYALLAWHTEAVGVDIERVERFKTEFLEAICTPEERSRPIPRADPEHYIASLWSSKEALAKALGNPLRYHPAQLGSPMFWPDGRSGPWRATALEVPPGHNGWLCWSAVS